MSELCMYGCGRPGTIKNKSNSGWRCANSPNSCPGVAAKKKQTLIDTYGVTNVSKIKDVQDKKKATWLKNYGVDNPSKAQVNKDKIKNKWPVIDEKRRVTSIKKYGVESYSSTEEFKTRRKHTWVEKYGVDNPTKSPVILQKVMESNALSEYRSKLLTLPSGKVIRYQGYEDRVITDLLASGIREEEIITGPGNVPVIKYIFNGNVHSYYPDIYLPTQNKLIEVKSQYTWDKYKERNEAKIQAAVDAGFLIEVIIK